MRPPTMTDEEADALWLEMCLELAKPPIETIAVNDNAGHIPVRKDQGPRRYCFAYTARTFMMAEWQDVR